MGWFRLFDRMRLRPETASVEGWGLPGSRLRLTDPNLASYFRELSAAAGMDASVDGYEFAAHLLARSAAPQAGRWHLDLRLIGKPARLLFGGNSAHTILSWHAPSQRATLQLPGKQAVDLDSVDLLALCGQHLALRELATLSAWLADAESLEVWLGKLEPFLSNASRAVIRLSADALDGLVTALPNWPVKPVALLPAEGETLPGEVDPRMDLLLCLESLSSRAPEQVAPHLTLDTPPPTFWHDLVPPPLVSGGLVVSTLEDAEVTGDQLVRLQGDAPTTEVGARMFGLQTIPLPALDGGFRQLALSAARLHRVEGQLVATTVSGMASLDPFVLGPESRPPHLPVPGPVRSVVDCPALLLGSPMNRESALTTLLPRLELASELIERERLSPEDIEIVCPQGLGPWGREALALFGFGASPVRSEIEDVLFSRLILAGPAAALAAPSRTALFDRFWRRVATMPLPSANRSFTAPRPTGKVLIAGPASLLLNERDLVELAQERRYTVLDPHRTRPAEAASLLREAQVVIAPAHFGIWSAFTQRCALGLLLADTETSLPYPALHAAAARRHSVVAMFGSGAGDDPGAGFVVAIDRLTALMDRLEHIADGLQRGDAV